MYTKIEKIEEEVKGIAREILEDTSL